jgi:hypothetical protein
VALKGSGVCACQCAMIVCIQGQWWARGWALAGSRKMALHNICCQTRHTYTTITSLLVAPPIRKVVREREMVDAQPMPSQGQPKARAGSAHPGIKALLLLRHQGLWWR